MTHTSCVRCYLHTKYGKSPTRAWWPSGAGSLDHFRSYRDRKKAFNTPIAAHTQTVKTKNAVLANMKLDFQKLFQPGQRQDSILLLFFSFSNWHCISPRHPLWLLLSLTQHRRTQSGTTFYKLLSMNKQKQQRTGGHWNPSCCRPSVHW